MTNRDLGVLVVGHGTRDVVGQAQMRTLACQTAGCLAPLPTELAFLELAEPTIQHGVASLAAAGVRQVITLPVLLFRAGHADRDIPEAVAAAAAKHAVQPLLQTPSLELQETVIELSGQRFHQALDRAGCAATPAESIALVMLARGSSSETAAAAMCRFAELRCQRTPVSQYRVGYVAVREPNVLQSLDWLSATSADVLVVQPHLLFEGEVFHSLCEAVKARQQNDNRRWVICQPLGPMPEDYHDDRLANVLAQLLHTQLERLDGRGGGEAKSGS